MDNLNGNVKRVQSRYINLDEDIYEALDIYSLNVYLALRYEGDYSKECSCVKKSVAQLMELSKVKRRQFFLSLNILENHGLIRREDKLGDITNYLVARTLNYFNVKPVQHTDTGGVHDMHGGVHQVHTDHKSIQELDHKDISESHDSRKTKSIKSLDSIQPIIDIWNNIAVPLGCPRQGKEKRSIEEIKRNIKIINLNWEHKLTAENFEKWLIVAIDVNFYLLTNPKFMKSLAVILRWEHFYEAYNKYINDNNNARR